MSDKVKRAERRHHEERIKDKFRRVVKGWWLWRKKMTAQDMKDLEMQAVQRAHHPQHQCEICHPDEKHLKRMREFEAEKKAPIEVEE